MFFRASCFGGQLSQWQVCLAVSLHGSQFTAVSCFAASYPCSPENADLGDNAYNDIISRLNVCNIGKRGKFIFTQ